MPKQTEYIYKKVELGSLINKDTIKEVIDPDIELDRMDDNTGNKNPNRELIVDNTCKIENMLSQQWSILGNVINYAHYSKNPKNLHAMIIKPINNSKINKGRKDKNTDEFLFRIDLACTSDRSMEKYLDRYEGVKSKILNTTRFDENSDLSTTYLGRSNMTQDDELTVEEKFSITEQGYTVGKLIDGTECQILLDNGASKSFMSKSHYLHCKSLHSLPKFASKTQKIQVGNGQYVSVLFIIRIIIDMVSGIKNVFKLEGVINL